MDSHWTIPTWDNFVNLTNFGSRAYFMAEFHDDSACLFLGKPKVVPFKQFKKVLFSDRASYWPWPYCPFVSPVGPMGL